MKNSLIKPRKVSGFQTYNEAENYILGTWLRIIESNYALYGFSKLFPRPLELREVLLSKGGIQKQIFGVSRLPEDKPTSLALPFDRTIPLANWIAMFESQIDFPFKRYDVGYSYRGERAQKGRFQGFYQADIDIIGRNSLSHDSDAECISLLYSTLRKLELGVPYICLNSISIVEGLMLYFQITKTQKKQFLKIFDDFSKVTESETIDKISKLDGLSQDLRKKLLQTLSYKGDLADFLQSLQIEKSSILEKAVSDLILVIERIEQHLGNKPKIVFAPYIVRGLDYYTGTVFETFIEGLEEFGSVCSGGRYDDLASTFTSSKLVGFGGSIGITRLLDLALKNNLINNQRKSEADILVCWKNKGLKNQAIQIASELRQIGVNTDFYLEDGPLSKQLKYGDSKGMELIVIVLGPNQYVLKTMEDGSQLDFTQKERVVEFIKFKK